MERRGGKGRKEGAEGDEGGIQGRRENEEEGVVRGE